MQAVILAGGLATRMRPRTETIPKALLEVSGEPFLAHQLRWLASTGVTQVVLSIGYRGEQIREYAGTGEKWGLGITYVEEKGELRGTAGAIRLAMDEGVLAERFLVTYGDSYLPISFAEVMSRFEQSGKPGLLCIYKNEGLWDTSNVEWLPPQALLYDKKRRDPNRNYAYIDYGLMAFERPIFKAVPAGVKSDLADLLFDLSQRGELAAYVAPKRFYEIGSPDGLRDLEVFLRTSL